MQNIFYKTKCKAMHGGYAFNPSIHKAEKGSSVSLRSAYTTYWVLDQPGLHSRTLSQSKQTKNKNKTNKIKSQDMKKFIK